jgi:hypothetical protein
VADGVSVSIGADTRSFDQAIRSGMVEPVQDAQAALDDYARAGDDAGDHLTRTFQDQQRSTSELKDDITRLNNTIRDGSGSAFRKAKDAGDDFTHKTSEGMSEVKESARSNAIEIGASFTGGFDQALGGLQGFLAEFLAGFGPGGVIAGVGIAALLGVIQGQMEQGTQAAEAQKQAVADLAAEYIDAGRSGQRSFDSVADAIKAMATSKPEDVIITLQSAFEKAKAAGADYEDVVRGMASGSPSEIRRVRDQVADLESAHLKTAHAVSRYGVESRGVYAANLENYAANQALADALGQAEKQAKDAGRAEALAARAGLSDLSLKRDLLGQLEAGYDDVAGNVSEFLNKEKTVLKVGDYIKAMERRRAELLKYKDELAKADLSPAAKKFLEGQGADTAAAMMRGYQAASRNRRRSWRRYGERRARRQRTVTGRRGEGPEGAEAGASEDSGASDPAPDASRLEEYLQREQPPVRIPVQLVTRNGTVVP